MDGIPLVGATATSICQLASVLSTQLILPSGPMEVTRPEDIKMTESIFDETSCTPDLGTSKGAVVVYFGRRILVFGPHVDAFHSTSCIGTPLRAMATQAAVETPKR